MCAYRIAVMKGDGIGPEVVPVALSAVERAADVYGFSVEFRELAAGDSALAEVGQALPDETVEGIRSSDAALKGPVGETAKDVIVRLRQMFDLYANLRPAKVYPGVRPLVDGVDMLIVRENTEDLYKGYEFELPGAAVALKVVTERASRRIAEYAFREAERRRRHVTIVHKSNVMQKTDGLFSRVAREVASSHPGVSYREMYVDAAAMAIVRDPLSFDVLLTMNVYGDILSDEAAQVVGGTRDGALSQRRRLHGALRAGPRIGPRHSREGPREPLRHCPLGLHDARLAVEVEGRSQAGASLRADRVRGRGGAEEGDSDARFGW
jgi:3-isopropylmalate dehydrogenase (EC 1.1.1.85)